MPVDKGMEAYENTSLNIVLVDLYSSGKNGIQSKGEVWKQLIEAKSTEHGIRIDWRIIKNDFKNT